jgi:CheY-like chemotaxis protein
MVRRHILLVDNDVHEVKRTEAALRSAEPRLEVVVANDGSEALDYLYRRGKHQSSPHTAPLFVLLNLNLPKVDGFEVLRTVKQDNRLKAIPIIVFTSSRRPDDVESCYRLGANAYIVKPDAPGKLNETMQALCEFWMLANLGPD